MSDEVAAPPSDGGGETSSVASTPAPAQTKAPEVTPREAVQRALAKVDAHPQPSGPDAPVAAAAKPEAIVSEDGRLRGPDGKFVAKEGEPPLEKPKRQPPSRFAKEALAHWETTPEPIQAEIDRAITELTSGLEKHKSAAESYASLKDFDERARRSGTTLTDALRNYTGIEDMLRANPVQGVVQIARNIGVHPVAIAQQIMRMAQQPQRPQQPPQFNPQRAFAPYAAKMQELQSQLEEIQTAPIKQEIARLQSKPFFEMLRPRMADLVTKGRAQTAAEAYDLAVAEDAQVKEAIEALNARKGSEAPQQGLTPEQIREKAKLSVTGSPTNGSNPTNRKPAGSAQEAVRNALSQVGLR
jgi:hypothetical protein